MISAPAKVNLFLEICGKRPDGYHNIRTVFAPLWNLHDDVSVTLSDGPGIAFSHSGRPISLPDKGQNICIKAIEQFCLAFGIKPSHAITLVKRIPVSAGLGGGSSDAAAVLREMCELHHVDINSPQILKLAAALGADVPFFLKPGLYAATGIGENLIPIFDDPQHRLGRTIAVIYPKFPSPVATAYRLADQNREKSPETFDAFLTDIKLGILPKLTFRNDLGDALIEKFPLLAILCDELFCQGAIAPTVSGSGSSVFALLPEKWNDFFQDRILQAMRPFNVEVFFSEI